MVLEERCRRRLVECLEGRFRRCRVPVVLEEYYLHPRRCLEVFPQKVRDQKTLLVSLLMNLRPLTLDSSVH